MKSYGLCDERGNVLFRKPAQEEYSGIFRKLNALAPYVLLASPALYAAGCGGGGNPNGPDGTPTPPPTKYSSVSGKVTNKVTKNPVSGCKITFTGPGGVKEVVSIGDGSYDAGSLPRGDYSITIENCNNWPNKTETAQISNGIFSFSVTVKNGEASEEMFLKFYDQVRRSPDTTPNGGVPGVIKWGDATPLREYYLATDGFSQKALDRLLRKNGNNWEGVLFDEVMANYPKAHCGKQYNGTFNMGPSKGDRVSGTHIIRSTPDRAGTAIALNQGNTILGMLTFFNSNEIETAGDSRLLYLVRHEVCGVGAGMADGYQYPGLKGIKSIMTEGIEFTNYDIVANCIAEDPGTAPGNYGSPGYFDTNREYPAGLASLANQKNEIQEIGDSGLYGIPNFQTQSSTNSKREDRNFREEITHERREREPRRE
jgi:hypothetical protein